MMRDPVCIVLNEREPEKFKAAEALATRLKHDNITSSRLSITPNIIEIVLKSCPRILVLDYLLGDYSTGLDILHSLQSVDPEKRPQTIFLTDEPSVPVAVEALKGGARDYLEIGNPDSINKIARNIKEILRQDRTPKKPENKFTLELDQLVAESRASQQMIKNASALVVKKPAIIAIEGVAGCGISTLANSIVKSISPENFLRTVDMKLSSQSPQEFLGFPRFTPNSLQIGDNLNVIIEHCEEDCGDLLEFVVKNYSKIWGNNKTLGCSSTLILCSSNLKTFKSWQNSLPIEKIQIPPLEQRKEDFPGLVQLFLREAEENVTKKIKPFSAEVINWLAGLEWPYQIKQLRSCVIDAAIKNLLFQSDLKETISENRLIWQEQAEMEALDQQIVIDSFSAAKVLEMSNWNYRIAAAKIGCGVQKLYETLKDAGADGK